MTTGTCPPGWGYTPVRALVHLENGYPFDSADFGPDGDIPLVRIRDLNADDFETYVSGHVPQRVVLRDGDVVIGMDGDFNVARWRRGPAALNQRLCLLRPKGNHDLRFVEYALPDHLQLINETQFSTTVKHLSSNEVLSVRLCVPNPEEQRRIADFLDDQVARIDQAIHARRTQERLAQERVDSEATTLMVEESSGWVPVRRVLAGPAQYGLVPEDDVTDDPALPRYIRTTDIDDSGRLLPDTFRSVSWSDASAYLLRCDDVLVSRAGSIGKCLVYHPEMGPSAFAGYLVRLRFVNYEPKLFRHFLRTPLFTSQVAAGAVQSTIQNFNAERYKELLLPAVPVHAQSRLLAELDETQRWAESMTAATSSAIAALEEWKRSLITAAVTGELDVSSGSLRAAEAVVGS